MANAYAATKKTKANIAAKKASGSSSSSPTTTNAKVGDTVNGKIVAGTRGGVVTRYKGESIDKTDGGRDLQYASPFQEIPGQDQPVDESVATEQPSPQNVNATPFTSEGPLQSYEQASSALATGGLSGGALSQAQQVLAGKYGKALGTLNQSGPAPQDSGAAMSAISGALPYEQDETLATAAITGDPVMDGILQSAYQLRTSFDSKSSLMEDYKKLYKQSGLDDINEELIDAETVLDGTEDDIRNEITTAGGFATESQVQAMTLARNKGLLKRYNQLFAAKQDATQQLNTMMNLNMQDRQLAQQKVSAQIDLMFKAADFRQQAINATKETNRFLLQTYGADGVYDMYKGDPNQLSRYESIVGLPSGGLQVAAAQAREKREAEEYLTSLQIEGLQASNYGKSLDNMKLERELGIGETSQDDYANALSQEGISSIDNLLGGSELGSAVGPNFLTRDIGSSGDFWARLGTGFFGGAAAGAAAGAPFAGVGAIPGAIIGSLVGAATGVASGSGSSFSGARQKAVAEVQQIAGQLTLDNLVNAKSRGATFGALSDSELRLLSATGSKIGTWEVRNDGDQVVGYNTTEKEMRSELDKINNFKKLDYILKGGDPSGVGVEVIGGHYYAHNSDGTVTQLR